MFTKARAHVDPEERDTWEESMLLTPEQAQEAERLRRRDAFRALAMMKGEPDE